MVRALHLAAVALFLPAVFGSRVLKRVPVGTCVSGASATGTGIISYPTGGAPYPNTTSAAPIATSAPTSIDTGAEPAAESAAAAAVSTTTTDCSAATVTVTSVSTVTTTVSAAPEASDSAAAVSSSPAAAPAAATSAAPYDMGNGTSPAYPTSSCGTTLRITTGSAPTGTAAPVIVLSTATVVPLPASTGSLNRRSHGRMVRKLLDHHHA